jgi:glucosamine--fructose-6-phosphate aminotransferase (isomerizing)
MCGIVGVIGSPQAATIVLEGLKRLEYRGYDSAGLALMDESGALHLCKAVGKLSALEAKIPTFLKSQQPNSPTACIGHTRWATHGTPTEANAHPHLGSSHGGNPIAVVHNGIIENYQELKHHLAHHGIAFASDTDTETIPCQIADEIAHHKVDLAEAVQAAVRKFQGSYAFVAMREGEPDLLVAARRGAPLCIGLGSEANYLVSDPLAVAGLTDNFIFLDDGDVAAVTAGEVQVFDAAGRVVERPVKQLDLAADAAGKQGYKHYMLKEIFDQPAALAHLLEAYTDAQTCRPRLPLSLDAKNLADIPQINIVACGTAYYAALAGKYALEQFAQVPVNVDVASEFRYRQPPMRNGGVFIAISQSGETADTLAALEYAKARFQHTIAVVNVPTSSIARAAADVLDLKSGHEIAVASTKAFTAMVATLTLLALQLAEATGKLTTAETVAQVRNLRRLPALLTDLLSHTAALEAAAERLALASSALYLGRGTLAAMALEGALKLKELTYIHAEGYASGEMKHGPIALVEPGFPVVNLAASNDGLFEKTLSNLKEVEARHGEVILLTDADGARRLDAQTRAGLTLLTVPTVPPLLLPIVFAVPLQLLAYYTAVAKGTDVDQPRNLAKSVTVE